MSVIKFDKSGFPTVQVDTGQIKVITKINDLFAESDGTVVFRFNDGQVCDFETSTDSVTKEGVPVVGDANAIVAALNTYLYDFFKKAVPGDGEGGGVSIEIQTFTATEGQTSYPVTDFVITDTNFLAFRDGMFLPSATRSGSNVITPAAQVGQQIAIVKL